MASTEPGTRRRPPGAVVAVCAAVLSIGIMFAMVDWWPGPGRRLDGATNWVITVGLGGLLAVVGLVWAIKTLHVVGEDRRWSWWIVPAPAIVVTALLAGLLVPGPSFESARGDFEAAVAAMPESESWQDVEFGPFGISSITRHRDGAIYFIDEGQVFLSATGGWVYSPAGQPAGEHYRNFEATHIDGPWYEFSGALIM